MKSRSEVERIKEMYRPGMRVRLVKMEDLQAPPIGTEGTICGVDDIGSVMVLWDTGSSLNVILEEDEIVIIEEQEAVVYTAYSNEADITFIMEDKGKTTSVVGFYYGESYEEATKIHYGKLKAVFE